MTGASATLADQTRKTWKKKGSYSEAEMLGFANREYEANLPYLPVPPFLLVQRILHVDNDGGNFQKGCSVAEYDIDPYHPIFGWHFPEFPVLPGSFGVEAAWQLAGFHLTWLGARGVGMATGMGKTSLRGKILPSAQRLCISLDVEQFRISEKLSTIQGDVEILCDGKEAYTMMGVKVAILARQ